VADTDLEQRERGRRRGFACLAGFSSFCDFFLTQNKGVGSSQVTQALH